MLPVAVNFCAAASYVSAEASTGVPPTPTPPTSSTEPSLNVVRFEPICAAPVRAAAGAPLVAANGEPVRQIPSWHQPLSGQAVPVAVSGRFVLVSTKFTAPVQATCFSRPGVYGGRRLESISSGAHRRSMQVSHAGQTSLTILADTTTKHT